MDKNKIFTASKIKLDEDNYKKNRIVSTRVGLRLQKHCDEYISQKLTKLSRTKKPT